MRGDFIGVWSETWREIWLPLIDDEDVPEHIFCELYRALAPALKSQPSVEALADTIDMSILLAGFTPYLSNALDADVVYRGG